MTTVLLCSTSAMWIVHWTNVAVSESSSCHIVCAVARRYAQICVVPLYGWMCHVVLLASVLRLGFVVAAWGRDLDVMFGCAPMIKTLTYTALLIAGRCGCKTS